MTRDFGSPPYKSSRASHPAVAEALPVFIKRLPGYVVELERCVQAADWEGLRMLAHQLKGTGKSYGFEAVTELAAQADRLIQSGDAAGAETVVRELAAYLRGIGL